MIGITTPLIELLIRLCIPSMVEELQCFWRKMIFDQLATASTLCTTHLFNVSGTLMAVRTIEMARMAVLTNVGRRKGNLSKKEPKMK